MQVFRRFIPLVALALAGAGIAAVAALAARQPQKRNPTPARSAKIRTGPKIDADHDGESGEGLNTDNPQPLPVAQMESALQAKGSVANGVLQVMVPRTDIGTISLVSPAGTVPVHPSWEVHHTLSFQPLADGKAFFNGNLALRTSEIDTAISAIIGNGLVFQAEHQHMVDFQPMIWFVHFRGTGDPVALAQKVNAVMKAVGTPLPFAPPPNPTTPLDVNRLKSILHGFGATVASDGVVTVDVARRNTELIDGIRVDYASNIMTHVDFEPLNASGSDTAVMPDLDLVASEVNPVVGFLRSKGWDSGCLYNQETDEHPQLYFNHEFKHGDPYALAQELRQALDRMNTQ